MSERLNLDNNLSEEQQERKMSQYDTDTVLV